MKSTRVAFIIVSLITVFLLVGSAVLQRIVFSAAESSSAVYFNPSTFSVKPAGTVELDLMADFSETAYVAAAQFIIRYDAQRLSYRDLDISRDFQIRKAEVGNGTVSILLVPSSIRGGVGEYSGTLKVATVEFESIAEGVATVAVDPAQSMISAVDPEGSYALYNALKSVQNSIGEISQQSISQEVAPPGEVQSVDSQPSLLTTQRITHSDIAPLAQLSLMTFDLRYLGNIRIDYGESEQLGNVSRTTTPAISHLLTLRNLEPSTKYFYRVSVLDVANNTTLTLPVRAFSTVELSSDGVIDVDQSQLLVSGSYTAGSSRLVFVGRDASGNLVDIQPTFRVRQGEAALVVGQLSGLPLVTATGLTSEKQTVSIEALVEGLAVARTSVAFDPSSETETIPRIVQQQGIPFTQSVQTYLLILISILLISALALRYLIRLR